ncbi:NADP-dependent oxidoreductase [Saccharomonospora sp. NPDC046836]|uniref:NADP-dependent oxidoreductase n=1 Tax=Saccharomonospora sp. NPDC046836 TaxID=3156921 RepID=UPI0034006CD6
MTAGIQAVLRRRPAGPVREGDIGLVEVELPAPGPDQILVRNEAMSLDPALRIRMRAEAGGYLPALAVGQPLEGWAVGQVIASRSDRLVEGDWVMHALGWREYALIDDGAGVLTTLRPERIEVTGGVPARWFLGPLGWVGLTAWVGLNDVAELRDGDVVFVSGAAGAVGGLAVQIAKLCGHTVIGSAGTPAKVRHVRETLGADAAFCYRDGPAADLLRAAAPNGIDVYFDNVGGDQLTAALDLLREHGRVALCGAISTYELPGDTPGPPNLFNAVAKGLTLRGFLARMYPHRLAEFRTLMREWLSSGAISYPETITRGLSSAPAAFREMLNGGNIGKSIVEL